MRVLVIFLALAALAGCGFRPLYAPTESGAAVFGPVSVAEIAGKAGHAMRMELTRRFGAQSPGAGQPTRQLTVTLSEQVERLGFRVDESAQRADLIVTATYVLETPGEAAPITGEISTRVGFDVPDSAFGEITAQDDARERAGEVLAQMLHAELAIRLTQAP
jgi:LPS-assembly lipoprotein